MVTSRILSNKKAVLPGSTAAGEKPTELTPAFSLVVFAAVASQHNTGTMAPMVFEAALIASLNSHHWNYPGTHNFLRSTRWVQSVQRYQAIPFNPPPP